MASDIKSDYNNMITAAQAKTKAIEAYNGLEIEKSIVAQFESYSDSNNGSESLAGSKWYDEACSTLVIKKYQTDIFGVSTKQVVASDKVNVTWGASQEIGDSGVKLYQNGFKAGIDMKWKTDGRITLPSQTSVTLNNSVVSVHLDSCDFIIPDTSINDSKY